MLAAIVAGCSQRPDTGAVVASAIGGEARYADPARRPLAPPARLLTDATAQGLVRFDAAGQIEAGLAERWTVIDGGATYIFRLRRATWPGGAPVTAAEVVTSLRHQIAHGSRNPLAPFLTAIDQIVEMTPEVIEVRLARPRPDLLRLFAQPELAVTRRADEGGSGPLRIERGGATPLLTPVADPARIDPDDVRSPRPEDKVLLIGERAARAIERFAEHRSDLVSGGTFDDWPLLALTSVAPINLRVDPAAGLFGLAIVNRDGFLATPARRAAIAEALDPAAIAGAVSVAWLPTATILPDTLDSAAPPVVPAWAALQPADRIAEARTQVAAWTGGAVTLRVALPTGPGATLVYGAVAAGLGRIGVAAVRVGWSAAADLRLVDAVAPYDSARWYLATACQMCGDAAVTFLEAARDAPTLAERSQRIADADRALADDVAFVPIARPLRWSLVAQRLRQWQANSRAWHPLNRLRPDPI